MLLISRPQAGVCSAPHLGEPQRQPSVPPIGPGRPSHLHSSSAFSLGFTDQEAIQELESSLKEVRKAASGTALYYAGLFLWLLGRHDKAKEYIDRMLKVSSSSREVLALRIWGQEPKRAATQHIMGGCGRYPHRGPLGRAQPDSDKTLGFVGAPTTLSQGLARYTLAFAQSPSCR